jgi:hypothetical protein
VVPSEGISAECAAFLKDPAQSDLATGTQVHRVIREQLAKWFRDAGYGERIPIFMPDASFAEYTKRNTVTGGQGTVDLAYRMRSGDVIGIIEIKPANFRQLIEGEMQVDNYVDKANANDELKRRLQVKEFRRLAPTGIEPPLPTVWWQSREFQIRWCRPGLIFYKEIRKKKNKEEDKEKEKGKKQSPHRTREAQPADPRATAGARQIVLSNGLKVDATERPWQPPAWMPEELRQAVQTGALRDGVYRDRFAAPFMYGYFTNIIVYVHTSALGREYQFAREFPTNPHFYEEYAQQRGLNQWQERLIQTTLMTANYEMWSLIDPDREDPRDIYTAREELRTINTGLMKQIVAGNVLFLDIGVGFSAINNAARATVASQRNTAARSILKPAMPEVLPPRPPEVPFPLPPGVRQPPATIPIPNTPENAYIFEPFIQGIRSPGP